MGLLMICKPIDSWPGGYTVHRRRSQFDMSFGRNLDDLRRELDRLAAGDVIIELGVTDADIRNDGWPRATAKVPPPVKISFHSTKGPLTFATDRFDHWHDNLRAITLGLEALRKLDRFGITDRGDQYAGWKALPVAPSLSTDDAIDVLAKIADVDGYDPRPSARALVRMAKMHAHPDHGGSTELLDQVLAAEAVLL